MNDTLGDRFKTYYEHPAEHYLTRRTPVIVRMDGRAFHTFTSTMQRPFDPKFIEAMVLAGLYVYRSMQGCKMAYIQSDEASFVLTDYDGLETEAWFGYRKSKIESIAAAMMSVSFGRAMRLAGHNALPVFDARAFNVPESEVANYFLWRAKDWHRNSVQMLAQAHFAHTALQGKSIVQCLRMLSNARHPWKNLDDVERFGTFLVRNMAAPDDVLEIDDCLPCYKEIAKLWEGVNPKT